MIKGLGEFDTWMKIAVAVTIAVVPKNHYIGQLHCGSQSLLSIAA